MLALLTGIILVVGIFNLVRLTVLMIAADYYDFCHTKSIRTQDYSDNKPLISILIPAYNEELTVSKTVISVIEAEYSHKEIIVIDDGSKDKTSSIVRKLKKQFPDASLQLRTQKNAGKGVALNAGIKRAKGDLVMVLDADSTIAKDALQKVVPYFQDAHVEAIAANVALRDTGSWVSYLQRVEYVLSYRMKRAMTSLNMEYIIGGVGSVYRAETLKEVGGYRHNTITEDIDLSLNVLLRGNKMHKVQYAADVKTSTESVLTFKDLIKQRYRWKFGRLQAFVRYKELFFSRDKKHGKFLTWFQLPYALFGELYLLLEPVFFGAIMYVAYAYGDIQSILTALSVLGVFMALNYASSDDLSVREKAIFIYMIPLTYFLLPMLAAVELWSLVLSIKNWRELNPNANTTGTWTHVKRAGA